MTALHLAIENVSRRGFLRGMLATGGLVVAAEFLPTRAALAYATGAAKFSGGVVSDPHVFVSIDPGGIVTIIAHRAEMGTGSRTSLPMVVADELDADWARVRVKQSPGDEKKYGNQNTDGSRSLRHFIQPMRQCGAAARRMLEMAAAAQWSVDVAEVQAQNHEVVHKPSGRKLGYGDLAAAASALPTPPPDQIKLKDQAAFRYIGKGNVPIVDLFDITTGRATFGIDAKLPGMKYAVVARAPVLGAKLASYDATAAMKVPGVEKIVVIDGTPPPAKFQPVGGVAVVAANTWAAIKGRDALVVQLGRRSARHLRFRRLQGATRRDRRQAGQDGPQRRRRRPGARHGGKDNYRRVLRSGPGARADGAADRHCPRRRREGRGLGAGAEPGRSPG